jgi:hypothetical protein
VVDRPDCCISWIVGWGVFFFPKIPPVDIAGECEWGIGYLAEEFRPFF